ncbi:MAG: TadE family protein [Isosphaeraceae bacterium]
MVLWSASPKRSARRAAVAAEFALIAPVFLVMFLGIVEFGRVIMVQQILVNAAREGARQAILPLETDAQVAQAVSNYLATTGISGYTETLSPTLASNPASGAALTLTISVPYASVGWLPNMPLMSYFQGKTLSATVVMIKE